MVLEKDEVVEEQEAQAALYWGHINLFGSALTG